MKCNSLMMKEITNADWKDISLPEELQLWVDCGFIRVDGCVFLAGLFKGNLGINNHFDKTGIECFVNSFHVDDYVSERYLDYSCLFCNEILRQWEHNNDDKAEYLNVIISLDDFGAVIKVHMKREGESWLNSNLDKYEDAILETSTPL